MRQADYGGVVPGFPVLLWWYNDCVGTNPSLFLAQVFHPLRQPMTAPALDLLVVDDDDEFRDTLRSRFSRSGFEVRAAANGEEALGLAQRRNFDVAIFDMMMPGMNGLELLKRFKADHPECEVILLRGQGSIETAVEAMKLGAYDYLQKPFSLKELEVIANKASERRNLR